MLPIVSGEARTRLDTWLPRLILLVAGVYFAVMAGRWIASPGLEYDELIFVNAATGEPTNGMFVQRRVLGVPVILMGYIGALKAYLYYPVFQIFGVSPQTVRWPVIVFSLATLALTYRVARFSFGRLVSALVVLVMSVDPTFMYVTKLDYQVALMMVLKVTALLFALRAVSTGSSRYLWGMAAACGLGVFDKLNFIWFLLALVSAGAMLFRTELREMWRRDRAALVLPVTMLALIGLATVARSIRLGLAMRDGAASVAPLDRLRDMINLYASTMNGRYFYQLVTMRTLAAESLMNPIVAFGLAGMVVMSLRAARRAGAVRRMPFQERVLLCHLLIFTLIAVQIVVTPVAYGAHHIMVLYPFQLLVTFGGAAAVAGMWGTAATAVVLVASGLNVGAAYERNFRPTAEFRPQWSPVVYQLVDFLNHHPAERIVSVDWGIHNQIWALGTSRTRAIARERWFQFRWLDDLSAQERTSLRGDFEGIRGLAILYGPGGTVNDFGTGPNFLKWCAAMGIVPRLERVFTSPAGTVIYEVYAVDGSDFPPSGPAPTTASPRGSR
jgi:4-amino-4-deoxy-L-arabinose transferase-like glycosyltransferase